MISDRYCTTEFAACSYALCDGVTGAFFNGREMDRSHGLWVWVVFPQGVPVIFGSIASGGLLPLLLFVCSSASAGFLGFSPFSSKGKFFL